MIPALISWTMMLLINHIIIKQSLSGKLRPRASIFLAGTFIIMCIIISIALPEHIRPALGALGVTMTLAWPIFTFRNIQKGRSLFLSVLILGVLLNLSAIVRWSTYIATGVLLENFAIDLTANSIMLLTCVLTARSGFLVKVFSQIVQLDRHIKVMLLLAIWISALIAALFSFFYADIGRVSGFVEIAVLTAALIILVGIMCPLLIVKQLSSLHFKNLVQIMDKQVYAQLSHYTAMSKMTDEIGRFQHDFKNLKIGIASALDRNDIQGALSLLNIDEIFDRNQEFLFSTGDHVLDALLAEKAQAAERVATATIKLTGAMPSELLNPVDICIIFGNALDNAIEACAKCPRESDKAILIKLRYANRFLFIDIENPTAGDTRIMGNYIATTKADKHIHGIGLRSINTAIRKYSGTMRLESEDNIFRLSVELDFNELS